MARVSLDLEDPEELAVLGTTGWRIAPGLVPGEPNQGLVAELKDSPARLSDCRTSSESSVIGQQSSVLQETRMTVD